MAMAKAYAVILHDLDGIDEFPERRFVVHPGIKAFLSKDDNTTLGVGLGRSSKALGHNKYYKAAEDNAWIESPTVSRRHAALSVDCNAPSLTLINVAATHGLFVNDTKIEEGQHHVLKQDDAIQLSSEVKRGDETIPPRRFKIHFHMALDTESSEEPLVSKVYEVPDSSDDEDDGVDEIDEDDEVIYPESSSDNSESASSENSDLISDGLNEAEIIMDSVNPAFSDIDPSEDEALDSEIAYGQGDDFSDEDAGINSEVEHNTNLDSGVAEVDDDDMGSSDRQSSPAEDLLEARLMTTTSTWSDSLPAALRDQASVSVLPMDTILPETAPTVCIQRTPTAEPPFDMTTMSSAEDMQDGDSARRSKLSQMISEANKERTPQSATTFSDPFSAATFTRETEFGNVPSYNRSLTTSMPIEHMIEPLDREVRPLIPSVYPDQLSGQRMWDTMYSKAGNSFSPTLALDGTSNPWTEGLQLNAYQDGPFASRKDADKSKAPNGLNFNSTTSLNMPPPHPTTPPNNHMTMRSGISIPDIIDTPLLHVQGRTSSHPLKRKSASSESMEAPTTNADVAMGNSGTERTEEPAQSTPAVPCEGDVLKATDESTPPAKKVKLTTKQSAMHAGGSSTRRRGAKKTSLQKVGSALATASIGAFVGGLTVFTALAFLPEAIFQ